MPGFREHVDEDEVGRSPFRRRGYCASLPLGRPLSRLRYFDSCPPLRVVPWRPSARVSLSPRITLNNRGYFMPILQRSIQLLGKPLPKVVSPRAHTMAHYSTAALFGVAAALFWRKN